MGGCSANTLSRGEVPCRQAPIDVDSGNPAELSMALLFGGLYAFVSLSIAAAGDYLGSPGLYAVAVLSGLHDLDAITLSTARLAGDGQIASATAWRLILTAALSNLVLKGAVVAVVGRRQLFRHLARLFGLALGAGLLILLLWPAAN